MKISVVLATYNGQKYIEEQLFSIVNQTQIPNEILVFDDKSTDETVNIINNFAEKYTNINWIIKVNKKNRGFKANFMHLINEAEGDIIFLSDQDDIWNKNKIKKMTIEFKKNSSIKVLVTDFNNLIMTDGIKDKNAEKIIYGKPVNENLVFVDFDKRNYLNARPGWTFAISSEVKPLYNSIFNFSRELYHDEILWYVGLLYNGLFHYKFISGEWRRFGESVTAITEESKFKRFYNLLSNRYHRSDDLVKIYKLARNNNLKTTNYFGFYAYLRRYFFKMLCFFWGDK